MKKKLLSLGLAAVMLFGLLPVSASAQEMRYGVSGNYEYERLGNNEIRLIALRNSDKMEELVIPAEIDGQKVVSIGFEDMWGLNCKRLVLPSTVRTIERYSFNGCDELREIQFAEGLETIEKSAFGVCERLTTVTLPKSLKTIGESAFGYCDRLETVQLSEGVEKIEKEAFEYCRKLQTINFPDSLQTIGVDAFERCKKLKIPTIPKNVKSLQNAFRNCPNIETIVIDPENPYLEVKKNVVFSKDGKTLFFAHQMNKKTYTIPKGVEVIGDRAFSYGCPNLRRVVFPKGLKIIGRSAFSGRPLQEIVLPDTVTSIGNYAFYYTKATKVKLSSKLETIGSYAFYRVPVKTLTIPKSVRTIKTGAFESCYQLKKVTVKSTKLSIQKWAFYSCNSLKSIRLPKNVRLGKGSIGIRFGSVIKDFKLYGVKGSAAESYAKKNKIKFVAV